MKRLVLLAIITSVFGWDAFSQVEGKSEEVPKSREYQFNPSIRVGAGLMRFYGDVEDVNSTTVHRLGNRFGYNFAVSGNISNSFDIVINALIGKLSGNENEHRQHRNFESDVFALGANLEYNFNGLYRKKGSGIVKPFLSIGFSYTDYDTRADLYSADGERYYYWSDGLIRNEPEGQAGTDNREFLERDYDYETSLTETPVVSYAVPASAGLELSVGRGLSFRLSSTYFYTFTDKIDNFDNPEYSKFDDRFLYNSISVKWNFMNWPEKKKPGADQEVYFADFDGVENADEDEDGVKDMLDKCAGTPKGAKVDNFGCPKDSDGDGIPDYRDKEPNTQRNRVVYPSGVAISFQKLAEEANDSTIGFMRQRVTEAYINSQPREGYKYTVHVGTYGNEIPPNLHKKLKAIPGLVEKKINDTLTIYTTGSYEDFEEAEQKQNELIEQGIDESFAVADDVVEEISPELEAKKKEVKSKEKQSGVVASKRIDVKEKKEQVLFKVRLTEYRLRLELDKLSQIMAEHGVEMRTSPGGLKIYTIGSFESKAEAEALKERILGLGIKEAEVVASYNNQGVSVERALELMEKNK